MSLEAKREQVEMVQTSQIHMLNPRSRSKRVQRELVENIQAVGLKRPITVCRRSDGRGTKNYDLVCGQGRLEAYVALNQPEIPAFVIEVTQEDCLVMSLVENIARRQHRPIDLMNEIRCLRDRGHSDPQIAELIGVTASWVNMITALLDRGEEKLVAAVETGLIPVSMATNIARGTEAEIQNLLTEAYEQGFRGKKLSMLRRLLEARSSRQKQIRSNPLGERRGKRKRLTVSDLRKMFEREAERRRLDLKKAEFTRERLIFATQALKELFSTPAFVKVLKVEKLDLIPKLIQQRIQESGGGT